MTPQTAVSRTIEAELAAAGKSKEGLADSLGIDRRNLYNRLAGKTAWSVNELETTARYLGFSLWKLLDAAEHRQTPEDREPTQS